MLVSAIVAALTAYLLGNLNGAVCMSVLAGRQDVRGLGSGNAGLTNFIRNYGVTGAVPVVLIDAMKAVFACLSAGLIFKPFGYEMEGMALGGLMVMLGHDFPALMGFKGGKGIMSGCAIAFTIDWRIGVLILAIFLLAYLLTHYVSLGSVLASAAFAVGFAVFHHDRIWVMLGGVAMGLLALFMHRENIVRLLTGKERKTYLLGESKQNQKK